MVQIKTKKQNPLFLPLLCVSLLYFLETGKAVSPSGGSKNSDDWEMAETAYDEKLGEHSAILDCDSNMSRRRVAEIEKRYISYETLIRDLVPCDTPGASYYNCRGGGIGHGEVNYYSRGCQIITRCARG